MTENTTTTENVTAAAPQANHGEVMMTRNPKMGGKGVVKMSVPASQVEDFKAAGWTAEA